MTRLANLTDDITGFVVMRLGDMSFDRGRIFQLLEVVIDGVRPSLAISVAVVYMLGMHIETERVMILSGH